MTTAHPSHPTLLPNNHLPSTAADALINYAIICFSSDRHDPHWSALLWVCLLPFLLLTLPYFPSHHQFYNSSHYNAIHASGSQRSRSKAAWPTTSTLQHLWTAGFPAWPTMSTLQHPWIARFPGAFQTLRAGTLDSSQTEGGLHLLPLLS